MFDLNHLSMECQCFLNGSKGDAQSLCYFVKITFLVFDFSLVQSSSLNALPSHDLVVSL